MAGVFPPQGSAAGGNPTGYAESGGVVTITDALNVGNATQAVAEGDFAVNGSGGYSLVFDSSAGTHYIGQGGGAVFSHSVSTAAFSLNGSGLIQWSGSGSAVTAKTLQLDQVSAGRIAVSDPSGSAGARLDLLDSAGNVDAYIAEASGAILVNGSTGINFGRGGATQMQLTSAGLIPITAGGLPIGTTSKPWNALTLGDGTAQVTLGHDGATDGLVRIADPNGAAGGSLALLDTGSNQDLALSIGASSAGTVSSPNGVLVLNGSSGVVLQESGTTRWNVTSALTPNVAGAQDVGSTAREIRDVYTSGTIYLGAGQEARILTGTGTPEGAVTAPVGALFIRSDGGASTVLYVKESGTGNTGWVAK